MKYVEICIVIKIEFSKKYMLLDVIIKREENRDEIKN